MTSQPSGIRPQLLTTLRPWRRRIVTLVVLWIGLALVLALFGVRPDATRLAVVLLAIAVTLWYAIDHYGSTHVTLWPVTDSSLSNSNRGNDFRATNLANRLELANTSGDGRAELVHTLHDQLSLVIRERLYSKHGFTLEEEPRLAEGVMPTELWDFLVSLPPTDLYRPDTLDPILRRIEQW